MSSLNIAFPEVFTCSESMIDVVRQAVLSSIVLRTCDVTISSFYYSGSKQFNRFQYIYVISKVASV